MRSGVGNLLLGGRGGRLALRQRVGSSVPLRFPAKQTANLPLRLHLPSEIDLSAAPPRLAGHIPALDGLRGLAILLVVVNHLFLATARDFSPGLVKLAHTGWVGVDLFFVLSGFLITGILFDSRSDPHHFRNFYARRALRIFPLYYAAVFLIVIVLPALLHLIGSGGGELAGSLRDVRAHQAWLWCYGSNLLQGSRSMDWNLAGHFWSLAVEEHFYLIWPAVLFLMPSRRAAMRLCIGIALAALLVRTALVATAFRSIDVYFLTPCRIDSLAIGGFVALIVRGPGGIDSILQPAMRIAIASGIVLTGWIRVNGGLDNHCDRLVQTLGFTLLAVFFAATLVLAVAAPTGSVRDRVFTHPVLLTLGRYSYGIYVFHHLALYLLPSLVSPATLRACVGGSRIGAALLHMALLCTLTFAAAWLSWRLFEKRFLSLKRHFHAAPVAPLPLTLRAA